MALENLKFWKKKSDELPEVDSYPEESSLKSSISPQEGELGSPKIEPKMPRFAESFGLKEEQSTGDLNRDVQLILSKLDTIKAIVDSLDHRIERLERIAEGRE